MLTLYKNRNTVTFTYSYDRNGEGRDSQPDVIVDDSAAAADSHAVHFLPTSTPRMSYPSEAAADDAASYVECFLYEGTYFDAVSDADFGPCRCGGRHGQGRFLSQDPVGLFDDDPNIYRYVSDIPRSLDEDAP